MQYYDDRTCPICGKTFCVPDIDVWAYKFRVGTSRGYSKTTYVCSWHCLQKIRKKRESVIRGKKTNSGERIIQMLKEGKSNDEIMDEVGCTYKTIKYWLAKLLDHEVKTK